MDREQRRMLRELGADPAARILEIFKRQGRETVTGISRALGLSYMTARNHCAELKKLGYLDTWRQIRPTGRPEILHFLSKKGEAYFADKISADWIMRAFSAAKKLYGPASPEKLLLALFEERTAEYASRMKGATPKERLEEFAKIRDAEGWMADVVQREGEPALRECLDPLAELATAYPVVERLEVEMLATLVGCGVRLEREMTHGLGPKYFVLEIGE